MDIENVDRFTVERDGDEVLIKFMDMFGNGQCYGFPIRDARKIRNALTRAINQRT